MHSALIGYTGFVGGNLAAQTHFHDLYNSKNSSDMRGKAYDFLVCSGAPAVKWKANTFPEEDYQNLQCLMENLSFVQAKQVVLISTVDVYRVPIGVSESTPIDVENLEPYGKHRYQLERFCMQQFAQVLVVRLPGLFGRGLKKNFIYDLLNENALHLTHCRSVFQFYNLEYLWKDIQRAIETRAPLVNFATEPVTVQEVAQECFQTVFDNETQKPSIFYDMHTEYAPVFGTQGNYLYSKQQVLRDIREFVVAERQKRIP